MRKFIADLGINLHILLCMLLFPDQHAQAYLSSMCCGDNFCCAILDYNKQGQCWGGRSDSWSSSDVGYVACSGKAGAFLSPTRVILNTYGEPGYGNDNSDAVLSYYIDNEIPILDMDYGFWGGCIVTFNTTIYCWAATLTDDDVSATLSPPPSTGWTDLACGGKRAGHWCCGIKGVLEGESMGACWGAGADMNYVPNTGGFTITNFVHASGGVDFMCALDSEGSVLCETQNSDSAQRKFALPGSTWDTSGRANSGFTQVGTSNFGLYALQPNGNVTSEGRTFTSAIGVVTEIGDEIFYPEDGPKLVQLSNTGGFNHVCSIEAGTFLPFCWGSDYANQRTNKPNFALYRAVSLRNAEVLAASANQTNSTNSTNSTDTSTNFTNSTNSTNSTDSSTNFTSSPTDDGSESINVVLLLLLLGGGIVVIGILLVIVRYRKHAGSTPQKTRKHLGNTQETLPENFENTEKQSGNFCEKDLDNLWKNSCDKPEKPKKPSGTLVREI